jgi:hypothetical protein
MRVFGEPALMSSGTIKGEYKDTVNCWLGRVWQNRSKRLATRVAKSKQQCKEFDNALEGESVLLVQVRKHLTAGSNCFRGSAVQDAGRAENGFLEA